MTPIERISARNKALSLLGVTGNPSKSELRRAFRKLAFEMHPDHGKGTPEQFAQISDAYNFLSETAEDEAAPQPTKIARMARPSVRTTETEFDAETLDACKDRLGDTGNLARHIATRLVRKGRMLTYIVPTRPADGLNSVALPTGDLVDSRQARPKRLDVWSGDIGSGVYHVPAQVCAHIFPGARSVQIRFGTVSRH